jgi:glycosyltransferase involved in cell wall biosynthesis
MIPDDIPGGGTDSTEGPLLHVFLLTYNRQKSLRTTLEAIVTSPLAGFPLTVMDNASPDATPEVCREFQTRLPLMEIRRHVRNIGFGANFLRSIELSRGEYTWILCDDDTLHADRIQALIDLLRDVRPEACFIGGPRQEAWPAGPRVLPSEIQRKCGTFLTGQSFVPALVFKSSLVTSSELVDAYFAIRTNFPQLVIGRKLFLADMPVAVLQPPVIHREDPAEKGANALDAVDGWSSFCRSLPPHLRDEAFLSYFGDPTYPGMTKNVAEMIAASIMNGAPNSGYHVSRIGLNCGLRVRACLWLCRPFCWVPRGVYLAAREVYRKVKYGLLGRPLPPTYHVPLVEDDLRR